ESWVVVNDTRLPVVCFVDGAAEGRNPQLLEAVAAEVTGAGEAWISTVRAGDVGLALRACVTNHRTGPADVEALVAVLGRARERCMVSS
ncbi:MAG TPA: pyridoxal-dependent decarboxylase, partial [Thermoanaerobaculia bacterium]